MHYGDASDAQLGDSYFLNEIPSLFCRHGVAFPIKPSSWILKIKGVLITEERIMGGTWSPDSEI